MFGCTGDGHGEVVVDFAMCRRNAIGELGCGWGGVVSLWMRVCVLADPVGVVYPVICRSLGSKKYYKN